MRFDDEKGWIKFMEMPVAELECYGVDLQTITAVEEHVGLYVKEVQFVRLVQLSEMRNVGPTRAKKFVAALHALKEAIEGGWYE